jgi:capsular exopolysaccharide synthesis family protein
MNNNAIVKPNVVDLSHLNPQDSGLSLSDIKQVIYRRWKPALLVAVVAFTGIFLKTALQTPEYQSETQILIENSKTQDTANVDPTQQGASQYYSIQDLSTEIFVLRSYALVDKAISQIQDRYSNLSTAEVIKNLSIIQASINKVPTDILSISYVDTDPERAKAILEILGENYVKYSLEKQRMQAANGIEFINSQIPKAQQELDEAAKSVRNFRQTNNLVDPESAAQEATGIQLSLEQQIKETEIAIELNKNKTKEIDRQLANLGQDSEILVASSVLGQDGVYSDIASQLKNIETEYNLKKVTFRDNYIIMEDLKAQQQELKAALRERAKQVLGKSASPTILDRVVSLPNYGASITTTTTTADPNISQPAPNTSDSTGNSATTQGFNNANTSNSSGTEVSTTGSTLQVFASQQLELQQEAATLQSKLKSLQQAKLQAKNNFQQIPHLQQAYMELQRQVELKSEAYNYLLERKQELEISEAKESAPWRILNAPYLPTEPVSPDIKQALVQAFVAAGFLGVATAFILQQLDQRIKQVEEVKQLTGLPILGIVPKVKEPIIDLNIATVRKSYSYYSSFTEGLRSLGMNLRYLMTETGRIKSLAFTSSTSAEGKTTVTYNLGLVLSEFGLRVLVVDADLRKPKIHKLAKVSNEAGLTDIISTDTPWLDLIKPNSKFENLHLITSGSTAPNPIALLNSEKMSRLLQEWQEAYDYVLIDTPPIGVIADAKSLANQVDTVVFVAGIQRANRKAMANSLDILYNSRCNLAGIVANLVDPQFDYYAYSYYDSYYNQPISNNNSNSNNDDDENGGIQNILHQFRRRND